MDRTDFLRLGGIAAAVANMPAVRAQAPSTTLDDTPADYTLRIGAGLVELAPDHIVSTTTYNGQFPGPLLRLREGQRVVVDVHNDTDTPEQLHWHGQTLPAAIDGAVEEHTPHIPPRGMRRLAVTPGPSGFRFYHTHVVAGENLGIGQYTGLMGPVYVEPRREPGAYDSEVFLVLKEFEPSLSRGGDMAMDFLAPGRRDSSLEETGEAGMRASRARGTAHGYEVGYRSFAINDRMLGHGEPIRVKRGERMLFHVLNGSATELRSLALPRHQFRVVALDGNTVPKPATVPVLWLGTAERVSAIVEMNHPEVWILGDLADDDRKNGMGAVVEYAGSHGKPQWIASKPSKWNYRRFTKPDAVASPVDEVIDLLFAKQNAAANGFNLWTINEEAFSMERMAPRFRLKHGKRYRPRMSNASDDIHPIHLHRHSFEISCIAGQPTAGLLKDVAMLGGYQTMDIDFTADQLGLSLFHCNMQLHMDFGFMALFECA